MASSTSVMDLSLRRPMTLSKILFGRTGGYYLFWASFVYFWIGMYSIFVNRFLSTEVIQIAWISVLALPFLVPPLGRWFNMDITWDQRLFSNKKGDKQVETDDNVVKFPYAVEPDPQPTAEELRKQEEEDNRPVYQVGTTMSGRVTLRLGTDSHWTSLSFSNEGVDRLIALLQAAKTPEDPEDTPCPT